MKWFVVSGGDEDLVWYWLGPTAIDRDDDGFLIKVNYDDRLPKTMKG